MSLLLLLLPLVLAALVHMGQMDPCEAGYQRENRFYCFLQAIKSESAVSRDAEGWLGGDPANPFARMALSNRTLGAHMLSAASTGSLESELVRSVRRLTILVGPQRALPDGWVHGPALDRVPTSNAITFTRVLLPFVFWLLGSKQNHAEVANLLSNFLRAALMAWHQNPRRGSHGSSYMIALGEMCLTFVEMKSACSAGGKRRQKVLKLLQKPVLILPTLF